MTAAECNVCGSRDTRLHHEQGRRQILKCHGCGLVFADPLPSSDEKYRIETEGFDGDVLEETEGFFHAYGRNYKEDAVTRGFRKTLSELARHRKPGRILDVGVGSGIFLHLAREAGWEPLGIELVEAGAEAAAKEFDLEVVTGDFANYPFEPESFDCIAMQDVLEHTLDPVAFLERASQLLRPNGLLYVAVPNQHSLFTLLVDLYLHCGGPGRSFFLDRLYVTPHLYYFNPKVMTLAMEAAGLEVLNVHGGHVALGRYVLPKWRRLVLEILLRTGALVGLSGRVHAFAKRR